MALEGEEGHAGTRDMALRRDAVMAFARIACAATRIGLGHMDLLSAGGHDARHMAPRCSTAMIFIPCHGGISHSPLEWGEPAHVAAGAAVLAETVRKLCT